jgi:hypothetical protein
VLVVVLVLERVSLDRIQSDKAMLVRIVAMLTKLLMRFDPEHTGSTRAQEA